MHQIHALNKGHVDDVAIVDDPLLLLVVNEGRTCKAPGHCLDDHQQHHGALLSDSLSAKRVEAHTILDRLDQLLLIDLSDIL